MVMKRDSKGKREKGEIAGRESWERGRERERGRKRERRERERRMVDT